MDNFRLNPPPAWPAFPTGWEPGPGWQPGKDLPVPLGWQLWIPVDERGEAPTEVDLQDYIDPFAAYLPGSSTINKEPAPVYAVKPLFAPKRAKTVFISTWLIVLSLIGGGGYLVYTALVDGGLVHAAVTAAAIAAATTFMTGLYVMVTGRPSWARLSAGRSSAPGPLLLGIFLTVAILAVPLFGVDVPAWVPLIDASGLIPSS